MAGFWAALGRLFMREVAPVLAEKGVEALEHRINRPKPAPVPRVDPEPPAVALPPVSEQLPVPVAVEPPKQTPLTKPSRVWEGWDTDNMFTETNLTKLAEETGEKRDDLLTSRNAIFALYEKQYRRAREKAGRRTNGASAAIFASEDFKTFVQTGELGE